MNYYIVTRKREVEETFRVTAENEDQLDHLISEGESERVEKLAESTHWSDLTIESEEPVE
jgi:hypothetical protein